MEVSSKRIFCKNKPKEKLTVRINQNMLKKKKKKKKKLTIFSCLKFHLDKKRA